MKIKVTHLSNMEVREVEVKVFTFSGGEQHVQIGKLKEGMKFGSRVIIEHEVRTSADLMTLVMAKNAIDHLLNFVPHQVELVMLYVPYARQDRVCEKGEAFGLEAFASIINSLNFARVTVADPHSDVTQALIKNLFIIPQEDIAFHALRWKLRKEDFALVSPDGGALKKIFKLSKKMDLPVHCADKIRDTATGEIIRTSINVDDFQGKNLMIVDDICDGGRTFIELAKVLRERNAGKIELYVTHGIFSKGMKELNVNFDCIHSFNIWENNVDNPCKLVQNQPELQQHILEDVLWRA